MNTATLTYRQICELRKRLKRKSGDRVRWIIDRLNVEANYKLFYGEDYESRGIKKSIY